MAPSRKRKYHWKPLPITLMLAVLIAGCIAVMALVSNKLGVEPVGAGISSESSSEEPTSSEPPPSQPDTARLIGVGDDLIHAAIYQQAKRAAGGEGYDFSPAYQNVEDLLSLADIASVNQETVMVGELPPSSYPNFNSPTALGDHLVDIGFNVFNLANNHAYDMTPAPVGLGAAALTSYLNFWDTHPDVKTVGLYRNEQDAYNIRILEKNGIKFSFLGMCHYTNGINAPKNTETVLTMIENEDMVKRQIELAKSMSDVVVVNVHWGREYTNDPTESLAAEPSPKEFGHKLIEWGADIVLGHHPHVIQPVEYIQRDDGTWGVAAYSLGNFISAQDRPYRMVGGALDVTVEKNQQTGETTLSGVRFIPMITQYEGDCQSVRTYPLDLYTEELAKAHGLAKKGFSMDFIHQDVGEVIPPEFLSPYQGDYTSAAPGPSRAGTADYSQEPGSSPESAAPESSAP